MRRQAAISRLMLLVTTVFWGGGFIFQKRLLEAGVSPFGIMAGRFVIASVYLAVLSAGKWRGLRRRDLVRALPAGVLLFLASLTQIAGLQTTTPGNSAMLTGAYVVFVPALSALLLRRAPSGRFFLCCLLCFAGVAVLSFEGGALRFSAGDALTLLCALLFPCHILAVGQVSDSLDSALYAFLQFAYCAVFSLAVLPFAGAEGPVRLNAGILASLFYLGLLSTGTGFLLQTLAQRTLSGSETGLFLSMESVFGAAFSLLLGYTGPSLSFFAGSLLVLASLVMINLAPREESKE